MSDILLLQPIFLPDEKRLQRNIDSLMSIHNYFTYQPNGVGGNQLIISIGGWAKTDELWAKFCNVVQSLFSGKIIPVRFDKNYGKAVIINTMMGKIKTQNIKFDYLFTMDSDIIFLQEQKDMLQRLVNAAQQCVQKKYKPFGMISLNQAGQNCHLPHVQENALEFEFATNNMIYKERIVWPNSPSGIAGGCLFIGRDFWNVVGGYKVFGVYAGDDAHLLLDCGNLGYSYQMFQTLNILHPMENDEEYAKWKVQACQGDTRTGIKNNLDYSIKNADDFWSKR